MNINKKYAIRKLAVGVASVSIGLFVANSVDSFSNLSNNFVYAASEQNEVIYTNPNPSEDLDANYTSNNTISKIEIIEKADDKIKIRIHFADGLAIKNKIQLKLADGLYSNPNGFTDLIFNNEVVGNIPPEDETRIKKYTEFTNFDDYYNYLKSIDKDSPEMNTFLNISFNDNFKKYDRNRFVDIEINKGNRDKYIVHYIKKDEPKDATTIEMDNYSKEIPNKVYLNNKEIYNFGGKHNLRIDNRKYTEYNYSEMLYKENEQVSYSYGSPENIKNKPFYLTNLYSVEPAGVYRQLSNSDFSILKNTSGKKVFKKGTRIKVEIKSNVVETLPLETTEKQINFYATGKQKYKETEIFKGKQLVDFSFDIENKQESKTNVALKRISDKIYEMEILEDVVFENEGILRHNLSLPSEIFNFKLKDNYIDFLNKEEYLKALKENKLSPLLGTTEVSIKEPDNTEIKKIHDSDIYGNVNTSYVFGESSTGTVKVVYVDENDNEIIPSEKIVENQPWYNVVEIAKKELDGYEFVSSSSSLKDLIMPGERTVTLKYKSVEKTREIPFDTIYKEDNTKNKNEKETVVEGINGIEKYKTANGKDIPGSVKVIQEKRDKIVKVGTKPTETVEKIPSPVRYEKDNSRDKGKENITVQGKDGSKTTTTTYTVNPKTGEVIPHVEDPVIVKPTETIIKVPAKDKVVEKKTELPIVEKQTNTLAKGKERIIPGRPRVEKEITEYKVNEKTGEITETKRTEVVDEGTPTIKEIGTREPVNKIINEQGKELTPEELTDYTDPNYGNPDGATEEGAPIYNVRRIIPTYKGDETLDKGKQIVEKDGKSDGNKIVKVGTKPTVVVETLPSPIRYEKDDTRDKGQENIVIKGKDGSKTTTTTYTVNPKTGEVEAHPQEPVIVNPTETIIKVPAKDKVEIVNKKDGSVIKITTTYTVNPKTGEITESKREEVIKPKTETSKGTDNPPVVENRDFVGGVNPSDSPIREGLPELKVAIIKDKENNILDVIKLEEQPKEIKGYKNTGKTEIDKDGYKVYIYEKIKESKPITQEKENKVDNKENKKEVINKKEELPKTSSAMLSTVGLLSIFGVRKNRKKNK